MPTIEPIKQTNSDVLATKVEMHATDMGDHAYLNWVLSNDDGYVNNGNFVVTDEEYEQWLEEGDTFMHSYVGEKLKLTYT